MSAEKSELHHLLYIQVFLDSFHSYKRDLTNCFFYFSPLEKPLWAQIEKAQNFFLSFFFKDLFEREREGEHGGEG